MRILITSVGTATSVNLIKYFKKLNDFIIGVDINDYGMTSGSLMCDEYYKVPYANTDEYVDCIKDIIKKSEAELIIPVNDIEIYVLSKCRDELGIKCIVPDTDTIEMLRDKYICSNMMKDMGLDVPEILNQDDIDRERILRDRIGVGSKGIEFIKSGDSAGSYDTDKCFLQECISGEEYTVDVLSDQYGNVAYVIPRKRLEVKSGVATKVLVENEPDLIKKVQFVLSKINLPGFSNFQFIKDNQGKYMFIEINYRFSGCGAASLATSEAYLEKFKNIVNGDRYTGQVNEDTRFDCIVTRYYEEVVYEKGIS